MAGGVAWREASKRLSPIRYGRRGKAVAGFGMRDAGFGMRDSGKVLPNAEIGLV